MTALIEEKMTENAERLGHVFRKELYNLQVCGLCACVCGCCVVLCCCVVLFLVCSLCLRVRA
jgi:hypothetical protein